jgi:hypothetical protein
MGKIENYLLILIQLNYITGEINKGNTRLLKYIYYKYIVNNVDGKRSNSSKDKKKDIKTFNEFYNTIMKKSRK